MIAENPMYATLNFTEKGEIEIYLCINIQQLIPGMMLLVQLFLSREEF